MATVEQAYRVLVDEDDDHGCGDIPESACREVPGNAVKLVGALTSQKIGDRVVDAKTVLAWLFSALAVPVSLTGLLVPIREAGSLLPQAALVPVVRRFARRKWVWIAGGLGQAAAVAAMAIVATSLDGLAAGVAVLAALGVFALSRSLSSIASKDVLGRTVPKGQRGQVTGVATVTSGLVVITVGLAIQRWGSEDADPAVFGLLLAGAAAMWLVAIGVFLTVREPRGEHDESLDAGSALDALRLLRDDAPFRRFVVARTLLLVSALTPPYVVAMATEHGDAGLAGLGVFVIAQGFASLLGGRAWGRLADRSSRRTIMVAAGAASAITIVFLAATTSSALVDTVWLFPLTYFLLALVHTGSRLGRKTYVVDLATGNRRTDYVAVSNTAMGVLLLVVGMASAALAQVGPEVALAALALLGSIGVPVARGLPEVSAGA